MPPLCRVMILSCGQGMTATVEVYDDGVVKAKADYLALIDCGGSGDQGTSAVTYVADKIKAKDYNLLDALIVSHQDGDHLNLLDTLNQKLDGTGWAPMNVFLGGANWTKTNKGIITSVLKDVGFETDDVEFNAPYLSHYAKVTSKSKLGYLDRHNNVYLRVLVSGLVAKGKGATDDIVRNASSAVVVVDAGTGCVVLPGDATYQTMAEVNSIATAKKFLPPVIGIEIPHHGAIRTAVENYYAKGDVDDFDWKIVKKFAQILDPKLAAASAAIWNSYHHPIDEVLGVFDPYMAKVPDHTYTSFVFAKGTGTTSEGWINSSGEDMAKYCTVQWADDNVGLCKFGNISIDLAPGLVAPEDIVTFHPIGTFTIGGARVDDDVVYAPAP